MLKPVRLSAECYDKHFAICILIQNEFEILSIWNIYFAGQSDIIFSGLIGNISSKVT